MKPKSLEIFIPGPAGRLEAKYYKNPKFGSPVAIVLHPHPQYGGTMNNRIVQLMYNIFLENGFSVIKINFRAPVAGFPGRHDFVIQRHAVGTGVNNE